MSNKIIEIFQKIKSLNKRAITVIVLTSTFLILFITCIILINYVDRPTEKATIENEKFEYIIDNIENISYDYRNIFDDDQPIQIQAAEKFGVHPDFTEKAIKQGVLKELKTNRYYYLHDVSLPYLTANAADLLQQIGKMYQEQMNGNTQQLRITSCLRSDKIIKRLQQRRNPNAITNSCHLYGTTFDIGYSRMTRNDRHVLAKILYALRKAGYCYVKYEVKQPCFHITVRR